MALFSIILPVFALIAIGVIARSRRLLEPVAFRGLTDIVFFLAMPALLFGAIVEGGSFDLVGIASVYFAGCLTIFGLGLGLGLMLHLPLARAAMLALNASYGNTVMMGIPIIVAALGAEALPPLLAIVALHSAILLPLAGVLIEVAGAGERRPLAVVWSALQGVLRHPIIMSIVVASLWRTFALPVPAPIGEFLRLLGGAGVPLALICLGGSLPAPKAGAVGMEAVIGTVLKLAALPALVWAIGRWAGLPALPLTVATITAGMPTGANAFLLVRRAEALLEISAATVVATTLLSLLSLYLLLHFLA
jgi:predicted permease